MTSLRVLHVIDSLDPGGTEWQCVQLALGLARSGVHNGIFYLRPGSLLAELAGTGVSARHLRVASFQSPWFPHSLFRLTSAMRKWRPDVVQTYNFYSNIPGILAAVLARTPLRVTRRGDLGAYLRPNQYRADQWVSRFVHRVVANSEAVRRYLVGTERFPARKVVVIRNGLNARLWQDDSSCPHDQREAVVGMVAHFREQKDHGTFLGGAREIAASVPSVRFCLVGSGPLDGAIREQIAQLDLGSRVDLMSGVHGELLRAAVRRFRVSVLTSKDNEGLPNAVLESMAAGLPVVATAVGGATEIIEDGVTGFLVPPGEPRILADRVVRLLKNPLLAQQMGQRGRLKIEAEFTMDRMVEQFHCLYRETLAIKR